MTEDVMLNGTFQEKSFPALLAEIRKSGKTGILVAQKGKIVKRSFFLNGEPIASRSNIKKELLGEILCKRGKISRAQLDEVILESRKDSGDNFGQIITRKGILSQDELYANTKYQFISILFSLFAWEEGTYSFEEREAAGLVPPGLPRFHVKFSKLISEGVRQIRKEGLIDRILGRTDQVLKPTELSYRSEELSFQGADREVLEVLVDGITVQEVIDSVSLDPELTKKILYTLYNLGVVRLQVPVEPEKKEKAEEEKKETARQEAVSGEETQEEIPELDQASLASVMDDLMPEAAEGEESLEEGEAAETELPPDELDEELLPPQDEMEEEEAAEEVTELIDAAVDEAVGEAVDEPEAPAPDEEEVAAEPEAPAGDEEEAAAEEGLREEMEGEDEAVLVTSAADNDAGLEAEETTMQEDPEKAEEEEISDEAFAGEEETAAEGGEPQEEVLTPDQEAVLEEAVEKEAEGEATEVEDMSREEGSLPAGGPEKKKKKWPLLVGIPVVVLILLFGAMALFYAKKAKEIRTEKSAVAVPPEEQVETKTPEEIIHELAKNETTAGEAIPVPPEKAKSPAKSAPSASEKVVPEKQAVAVIPPVQEPPVDKTMPVKEASSPPSKPAPVKETPSGITADEEVPPPVSAMREPWENAYDAGLASFHDGNLESAFSNWSDVIRNAPNDAYSIQIELTSYLSYAARDIRASGPEEKVFIVESSLNKKPVYKVLCGIYSDKAAAEKAFRNLTPYLKAQNPYIIPVNRLKSRLEDFTS
ncbi:MAG: DUF4388 domain-containing protein [Deltaproteobacteria bacterium]|nr:DUF4388 domain-containing protein [Deltaproteobacteria bacterium]